ncbi:hypothetical protein D3C71_76090 [compost metagenome]
MLQLINLDKVVSKSIGAGFSPFKNLKIRLALAKIYSKYSLIRYNIIIFHIEKS